MGSKYLMEIMICDSKLNHLKVSKDRDDQLIEKKVYTQNDTQI